MQLQLYGRKIWLYRQPIDFRRSIDGLVELIHSELKQKPQELDKVKCLSWHKNGFILLYKRLEKGRFYFKQNPTNGVMEVGIDELSWLLAGLEWQKMRDWRELNYDKFS